MRLQNSRNRNFHHVAQRKALRRHRDRGPAKPPATGLKQAG